ncbi:small CPxCG-related zinc finger protein [Natronomonas moolapensis 8.8.11]|uniref:Small CPxCG-related zinc finger protein n=1 Tax=Natronomonas moolapensis (strain DSM 18674 / CECT 7526 / JCM 14361 / 8.8.11) TaxID=268739 RepID=M1XNI0_NATM8|nr:small CPxCG-related zinc finger protein [Natronomonas moolapensis 8.8.11]
MSSSASELGTCPFCGSAITAGAILVEYKVENETRVFAECYECEEPVQPQ